MTDINERVAVVEIQINNLDEKIDDLKIEVKSNHESLQTQLRNMAENSSSQHAQLSQKITSLEKTNHGWYMWLLGASAVVSSLLGIYNIIK